ncbi:MAG: bacterial regulatory, arsR family protein [Betaproteobacteria bacterium]|nr:bacterial regulatory, arsR family protein [Betaproteobacteria bacterium]
MPVTTRYAIPEPAAGMRLAPLGAIIGDPARAAMLWTLMDGTAKPAGELAYVAGASAQSASQHLAKMIDAGLLLQEVQGRHRYYRIARPEVATALEALMAAVGTTPKPRAVPAARRTPEELRYARTCYDHLAGELGVSIYDAMRAEHLLEGEGKEVQVTAAGHRWLAKLGIDEESLQGKRRTLACGCLDWSERRHHLAGTLGAALLSAMVREGWLMRSKKSRAVRVTPQGASALRKHFPRASLPV